MTNAELIQKIRAEIERRITDNTFGAKLELIDILAWLSTLESEKPNQDELEKEMDRFFETMPVLEHENIFEDTFKNIARHFAQWGAEHLKK